MARGCRLTRAPTTAWPQSASPGCAARKRDSVGHGSAATMPRLISPQGAAAVAHSWPAKDAADWGGPPADHITTRYETKKLGDCAPVFYDFVRA